MTERRAYFIELLASALNGVKPREKPDGVAFEDIYREAARQKLLSAVFCSVNRLDVKPPAELFQRWRTEFLRESLKSERMAGEASELTRALAEDGIPVMPLKGCVTRRLYPEPVYRSMCDIDLMYFTDDASFRGAMEKLGYALKSSGECHDVYIKGHYTRIEAHRRLFSEGCPYEALFSDIQKRALHDAEERSLLKMTDEDAYLHLLCHAAKHYKSSGIGLRVLADVYVTLKAHGAALDYTYLDEKLNSVGLGRFKDVLEQTANAWFGGGGVSLPIAAEDEFFLGTVYGNANTSAVRKASTKKSRAGKAKLVYYLNIIFLPKRLLQTLYPVLETQPWLLPACAVHRWCKKLLFGAERIKDVRRKASMLSDAGILRQNEAFGYFGLSEEVHGSADD